jgi:hypothetical protein
MILNFFALFRALGQLERLSCRVILREHIGHFPFRQAALPEEIEVEFRYLGEMGFVAGPITRWDLNSEVCILLDQFHTWKFLLKVDEGPAEIACPA